MRKILFILLVALIFQACENDNNTEDESVDFNLSFDKLTNSKVGQELNGEFVLGVSNKSLLSTYKKFATKFNSDIEVQSVAVITIDNKKYLRFYFDNGMISTIAIIKDRNGLYHTGNTICESVDCASGGGCIPEGVYCTECKPNRPSQPISTKGDCKRTTIGEN